MTDLPERASDEAVSFVLITPAGELLTRAADGRAVLDEWDTPYQGTLWAAVAAEVDPHRGLVNGIGLDNGMRAKVADISASVAAAMPQFYPPNPTAWAMLTILGAPADRWFGTVAITGTETDDGITMPLTDHQLDLITAAHRQARRPHR